MPRLVTPINDGDHRIGVPNGAATLVEYGDYQCLTCRMTVPIIKQLKKELGEKLCYAFRHFPLQQSHPFARMAAEVAEAASLQNRFWEMHELLYHNQMAFRPELFPQLANQLHLNVKQFESDLHSPIASQKIETDFHNGVLSGVNGTPCFFINGERYDGDASYETIKRTLMKAVNKEL